MKPAGRWCFGVTSLSVFLGLVIQVIVAVHFEEGFFDTPAKRALNVFAFFSIQSNIFVAVTTLLLALNPNRSSTTFKVARLTGIVAISITFVVFHAVLSKLVDLESWALVADNLLHTVVPALAVVGWLIFGPRNLTDRRVMWLSLLFPLAWCAFTLIRGEFVGWYPYPFIDVGVLGCSWTVYGSACCIWGWPAGSRAWTAGSLGSAALIESNRRQRAARYIREHSRTAAISHSTGIGRGLPTKAGVLVACGVWTG